MGHRARAVVVAVALFAVACGSDGGDREGAPPAATSAPQDARGPIREFEVDLYELDDSGVTGHATMRTASGGEQATLEIDLEDAPDGPLAVHMHSGPCTASPTTPTHVLDPISDGHLETQISAAVQGLTHGNFSLGIHATGAKGSKHIACGQISGPPADE